MHGKLYEVGLGLYKTGPKGISLTMQKPEGFRGKTSRVKL
jgi:hypothetical protein